LFENHRPNDPVICECELVPQSALDQILDSMRRQTIDPSIRSVSVRSRMGKGPCQGAFCGLRMAAHMYDRKSLRSDQGLDQLRLFFNERWKGQRPVLWDGQLVQVELSEAMHCGFLGLELDDPPDSERKP
jgi:glycerol-3-phosphate dehydrogenase